MSDIEIVELDDTVEESKPVIFKPSIPESSCSSKVGISAGCSSVEKVPDRKNFAGRVKDEPKCSHPKNNPAENKSKRLTQGADGSDGDSNDNTLIDLGLKQPKKKDQITEEDIQNLIVKCSSCGKQVNHHYKGVLKKHRHLGVLICRECFQFYSEGEFSEDEQGYNYCRWCAQGGKLYGCDFCPNTFCFDCVRRNFGRGEVRRIQDEAKWKCYVCEPSPLKEKIAFCDLIINYAKNLNDKKGKKLTKLSRPVSSVQMSSDSDDDIIDSASSKWLPFHINRIIFLCAKLQKKMYKLKCKHQKSEKSTKQIVTKFCDLIESYSTSFNGVEKTVRNKYDHYVLQKKKAKAGKENSITVSSVTENDAVISGDGTNPEAELHGGINGVMSDAKPTEEKIIKKSEEERVPMFTVVLDHAKNCNYTDEECSNGTSVVILDCEKPSVSSKTEVNSVNNSVSVDEPLQSNVKPSSEESVLKSENGVEQEVEKINGKHVAGYDIKSEASHSIKQENGDLGSMEIASAKEEQNCVKESIEHSTEDVLPLHSVVESLNHDDSDDNDPASSQSLLTDCLPLIENEEVSYDTAVVDRLQNSIADVLAKNEAAKKMLLSNMLNSDSENDSQQDVPDSENDSQQDVPDSENDSQQDVPDSENDSQQDVPDSDKYEKIKSPRNKTPLEKGKKYKGVIPKKSLETDIEDSLAQSNNATVELPRTKVTKSSSSSLSSSSDSDGSTRAKKSTGRKKRRDAPISEQGSSKDNDFHSILNHYANIYDDSKLLLKSRIYLEKLMLDLESDFEVEESQGSADEKKTDAKSNVANKEVDVANKEVDELAETYKKLSNLPKRKKISSSDSDSKGATGGKSTERKPKKPKLNEGDDSSSAPFSLSSSEEESKSAKINEADWGNISSVVDKMMDRNEVAKASLLDNVSASDSSSDSEVEITPRKIATSNNAPKKSKSKNSLQSDESSLEEPEKEEDDSDDDFQLPKKKSKYDKLLKTPFLEQNSDSSQKEKQTKKTKEKKHVKRKVISSDEDGTEKGKKKESSSSSEASSNSSGDDFKSKRGAKNQNSKAKKRKRIKEPNSSNSDAPKSDDEEILDGSQGASGGKGRKNIRKIISAKKLTEETKEAGEAEKERRRRVLERQKLYNQITEVIGERGEMITKKMVLEVDPDSKEEVVEIHPDIVEKLKPHQVNGVKFMWECTIESLKQLKSSAGSGCILAHCMGLGKTLQVIAFLLTVLTNKHTKDRLKTALVICPYNTVLNWAKEFETWLDDVGDVINLFEMAGAKDNYSRKDILEQWQEEGGVLIIGYDIFRRLVDGKMPRASKKLKESMFKHLADPGPDIVVCDEGHILKNESSAVSKATQKMKTQRRIVLTGTPLQNNLKEYHCMVHFVKPHLLGTAKEFRNRFVNPIINGQCADSSQYDVKKMKKRVHILHKLLQGCVQRCDYSALTSFLPDKHEFVISVKLSEAQIKMYAYFLERLAHGTENDGKVEGRQLFKDYNSLKNIWTHPYLVERSYIRTRDSKMFSDTESEGSMADFIDDDSANSSKSDSDGITFLDDNKPSTSKGKEDSSGDEIINKWKTRSRSRRGKKGSDNEVMEEPAPPPEEKHWWNDFVSEEDIFKLELSGKMVLVFEILRECELIGDKVLIFSQSLLTLNMLEELLAAEDEKYQTGENVASPDYIGSWALGLDYFRMDGSTNIEMRKKWIEIFNDKDNERARLFMISTKAGSLGTNLVGANRVIMLDASWNPSHDVQAIFRVFRFGQVKPVYIYRLLAQGTMEEKIYDRQVTKLSLQCRVIDEQNIERHFNASELAELYKFDPEGQSNRPTPMVPKDRLLAELLIKHKEWIVTYHEHDSLLQNVTEDDLTEEERRVAWQEYENEREGLLNNNPVYSFGGKIYDFSQDIPDELPCADRDVRRCVEMIKAESVGAGPNILLDKGVLAVTNLRRHYGELLRQIRNERVRISQSGPVPEKMENYITSLVASINKTDVYLAQLNQQRYMHMSMMKNSQAWRQQQAQQKQSPQQQFINVRGTTFVRGNYQQKNFVIPNAMHRNFPRGPQPWQNNAAGYNPPKPPTVTVVEVSSNSSSDAATSSSSSAKGDDPIITEVPDSTTYNQMPNQPRTRSQAPSTVTITELE